MSGQGHACSSHADRTLVHTPDHPDLPDTASDLWPQVQGLRSELASDGAVVSRLLSHVRAAQEIGGALLILNIHVPFPFVIFFWVV